MIVTVVLFDDENLLEVTRIINKNCREIIKIESDKKILDSYQIYNYLIYSKCKFFIFI